MKSIQDGLNIVSFKEGNRYEAKLAKGGLPDSLWDSYSSFANTDGGMSAPRNATILKMFSMIDIGERAGSGSIPGVFSVWNKAFGIMPEYTQRVSPDRTKTVLRLSNEVRPETSQNDTVNGTVNAILALIRQNSSITYEQMAEKSGVSRRTVNRVITELKNKAVLVRVGADKGGLWEIVEK
ncbi:MAG: winged helix-turn-helix transcriptional regulator [Treponema sp.]|nr:winged helix-turn-helix transcriptional regulator [Treponema sp.]